MSSTQASPTQIPWHPCMDEQAQLQIARLHLPVAPACNIRCTYCKRGMSPSNAFQSGPGQAESILAPRLALEKTTSYLDAYGHGAIVGIAGPGDPLANAETFETLELLFHHFPDIRLCLCTNGLCLADHVPFLKTIGMKHLSVTVNGIEPDVVEHIQPWIRYNGKEYCGRQAASLLIANQLRGIENAVSAQIFVKINYVDLPGINDHHILKTANKLKALGAGLLNLIPLLTGAPHKEFSPSTSIHRGHLQHLQEEASSVLPVFTRCKQCRADAEGIPGKRNSHAHQ